MENQNQQPQNQNQSQQQPQPIKRSFSTILKNIFWIILIMQFAPTVLRNIQKSIKDAMEPKSHVALINIKGVISSSDFYTKNIRKYLKDENIHALLLKIESPGGVPGSAQAIFNELKTFKEKKPVVAMIENIGTSAAYYISAASDHIIANPSSLVGSIGVWLNLPPNIKGLADRWDIKFRNIKSGKYKTIASPFKDDSPDELAQLQSVSDDSYNQFVKDIAESRNLSLKNKTEWADGKLLTGNQALKLKLIDQLGSVKDAIAKIKELTSIEHEIKFIRPKQPSKFMQLFTQEDDYNSEESQLSISCSDFVSTVIDKVIVKQSAGQKVELR